MDLNLKLNRFKGTLGVISAYTRPQPNDRLHLRRETEFGRFISSNLMSGQWADKMLNQNPAAVSETYNHIKDTFLLTNIYAWP